MSGGGMDCGKATTEQLYGGPLDGHAVPLCPEVKVLIMPVVAEGEPIRYEQYERAERGGRLDYVGPWRDG